MRKPIASAVVELLLLTKPLIAQTARGDKREKLQRTWINAFNHEAAQMLDLDTGRLPQSPRAAIEALMRLVMQLGKADGMTCPELRDFTDGVLDGADLIDLPDVEHGVRRGIALLGVLAARDMETQLPPQQETA